jgi:tetratricopeptide (TPR) repeat protein
MSHKARTNLDGSLLLNVRQQWLSHQLLCFAVLSALWILLLYSKVLHAPFVYDDIGAIVQNPTLASLHSTVTHFCTSPTWFTNSFRGPGGMTYRPLFWISLAMDGALWGLDNSGGFHFMNLVLHWANGLLLFSLLKGLTTSSRIALISALIWITLPINSEVVAWISARSYLLCSLFILMSLNAALVYLRGKDSRILVGYFFCALAALLSNEAGALLLLLIAVLFCAVRGGSRKEWIILASLLLTADLLCVALRMLVGVHGAKGPSAFWSIGIEFAKYLQWMILPLQMSVERSTSTPVNASSTVAVLACIGLIAYVGIVLAVRRKNPPFAIGLLWIGVALLPYCGIVFIYQGMAERYEYLASVGLALVAAALVAKPETGWRRVAAGCVVLWMLWGVWRLRSRTNDWTDPVLLYQNSLRATPNSPTLPLDLASTLMTVGLSYEQAGDTSGAEQQFKRAIDYAPQEIAPYNDLGILLFRQKRENEAIQYFQKAMAIKPLDPAPYFNLGVLFQETGRDDVALAFYKKVLQLQPQDTDTITQISKLHLH